MSGHTAFAVSPAVQTIGVSTPVTVVLTNPHGVRCVTAHLEQNGQQYPVFEQRLPATRFWWRKEPRPAASPSKPGRAKPRRSKKGKRGW